MEKLITVILLLVLMLFLIIDDELYRYKQNKKARQIRIGMLNEFKIMQDKNIRSFKVWHLFFQKWKKIIEINFSVGTEQYKSCINLLQTIQGEVKFKFKVYIPYI